MLMKEFFSSLLSWCVVFPAAALCIAPMRNQLRFGLAATVRNAAVFLVLLICAASYAESSLTLFFNALTPPVLALAFAAYHKSLRVPISKSLGVFALVCALFAFLTNFANGFDAARHPNATIDEFSLDATIFQLLLCAVAAALLFYPFWRYGAWLVDSFDVRRVWYITLPVNAIFLTYNLFLVPRRYETMHVNKVFLSFWVSLSLMLALLLLLCVIFYFIVAGMLEHAEVKARNRVLEMQESQYLMQRRYMEETAKERHDFKQNVRTMQELAEAGDYAALREYLAAFGASLPSNELARFCDNRPVNALLNYFALSAKRDGIALRVAATLPEAVGVSEVDLCGVIGNLLENASLACLELPEGDRWIRFTAEVRARSAVCIVVSNHFSGKVRQKDGRYLSTRHRGDGIGLASVAATAERCGGVANFRHEGDVFHSEVVLMMESDQ